jgi:Cu(I)/Ag(I) efflux system membrane fusion protein
MTQILEGLAPGDKVVTNGEFLLDSESQLKEAVQKMLDTGQESTEPMQMKKDQPEKKKENLNDLF